MKFRKKPIVIEAKRWDGKHIDDMEKWLHKNGADNTKIIIHNSEDDKHISIETLEGEMIASIGDWIIKGVKGEFYPCKPDIFEQTYDSIEK